MAHQSFVVRVTEPSKKTPGEFDENAFAGPGALEDEHCTVFVLHE
jgi:hypothetical protein